MIIRLLESSDWPDVWKMIEPVFRAGRTYPTPPDIEEPEARHYWIDTPEATFVAVDNEKIVGTYYLKPNQARARQPRLQLRLHRRRRRPGPGDCHGDVRALTRGGP
jgi:predicted N-acetyltransferase YhbS